MENNELTKQEKQVMAVIAQHLGLEKEKLSPELDLTDDLNLQPLEIADIAAILTETFRVEITPAEISKWQSVADAVRSVTEGGLSGSTETETEAEIKDGVDL